MQEACSRDKNPVRDHEPELIDSGDQMPSEPTLWGDDTGRQTLTSKPLRGPELRDGGTSRSDRKDRWLFQLWKSLRGSAKDPVEGRGS